MLFAAMNTNAVLMLAAAGAALFLIPRFGIKIDKKKLLAEVEQEAKESSINEERRRKAQTLMIWAERNGLSVLSSLLQNYSIGDKSGAMAAFREVSGIIGDTEKSKAVLDGFLKNQLDQHMATPEGRKKISEYIDASRINQGYDVGAKEKQAKVPKK